MGASLDITGAWPTRTDVVAWRHRSYLGRDNYVKVEEPGFLFPFGFRATRVKITERIIDDGIAILRKRHLHRGARARDRRSTGRTSPTPGATWPSSRP